MGVTWLPASRDGESFSVVDRPSGLSSAEKADQLDVLSHSVVSPSDSTALGTLGPTDSYVLWVAQAADTITPWGKSPKTRDKQLREFWPTENFLASALGIVSSRNAAFSWELKGPSRTVKLYQDVLLNANLGKGWEHFMMKLSIDLYSQDSGAFVELIRADNNSATSPVIGINHLDAARCFPTGDPENPVIYVDRKGSNHILKSWQVENITEMPSPVEHPALGPLYTLQYCAVTRLLRAAQILRNVSIYQEEKVGGRFARAIHLIKGITSKQVNDALAQQELRTDSQGLLRYQQPPMIGSVAPNVDVGHDTIELASLPDGFDQETMFKHYITAIAMAFLTDYQEFAPLPGGNLGTSAQSYILHLKSRGKGPALFQKLITHFFNFGGVLPKNVEFAFQEKDLQEEQEQAALAKLRAEERQIRIASQEITPAIARQMARDSGDLAPELFDAMGGGDLTPDQTLSDEEKPAEAQPQTTLPPEQQQPPAQPVTPPPPAQAQQSQPPVGTAAATKDEPQRQLGPPEVADEREQLEASIKEQARRALARMRKQIVSRIEAEQHGAKHNVVPHGPAHGGWGKHGEEELAAQNRVPYALRSPYLWAEEEKEGQPAGQATQASPLTPAEILLQGKTAPRRVRQVQHVLRNDAGQIVSVETEVEEVADA